MEDEDIARQMQTVDFRLLGQKAMPVQLYFRTGSAVGTYAFGVISSASIWCPILYTAYYSMGASQLRTMNKIARSLIFQFCQFSSYYSARTLQLKLN